MLNAIGILENTCGVTFSAERSKTLHFAPLAGTDRRNVFTHGANGTTRTAGAAAAWPHAEKVLRHSFAIRRKTYGGGP